MHTRRNLLMVVALLATTLFGSNAGIAAPATLANSAAPIRLKAATFTPALGQLPAIQPGLVAAEAARGRPGYYLIQFRGPVQQAWKDQVAAAGVELLGYIPDNAYKVRMTPEQAQQLAGMANVGWVGAFHPAYKLDTDLKRGGMHLYQALSERGADRAQAAAALAGTGALVLDGSSDSLLVAADTAQLDAIASVPDVAWVQNFTLPKTHNEYGGGVIIG